MIADRIPHELCVLTVHFDENTRLWHRTYNSAHLQGIFQHQGTRREAEEAEHFKEVRTGFDLRRISLLLIDKCEILSPSF